MSIFDNEIVVTDAESIKFCNEAVPAASFPTWPTMVACALVRVSQEATFPAAPPP
jgi:hypothetical protein